MRTGSPVNAWFKGRFREEFAWFAIADSLPILSIDGRRAAAQIVDAMRHGDAELVVTWPARLAIVAAAIAPNTVARSMDLVNRVLPSPTDDVRKREPQRIAQPVALGPVPAHTANGSLGRREQRAA